MICDEVSYLTTVLVQCYYKLRFRVPLMKCDEVSHLTTVLVQCKNSGLEFL